jgi:hypothetical protein
MDLGHAAGVRTEWKQWVRVEVETWSRILFVTVNFRSAIPGPDGSLVHVDEQLAKSEVKKLGSRIDRAVFGRNRVNRFNTRVRRIPFLEHAPTRGWHCHMMIEVPEESSTDEMITIIEREAVRSRWVVGPPDVRIGDIDVSNYLTKYRSKEEFEAWGDTIVVEAVVASTK